MGKVYDFQKARADKYTAPSYVAPEQIEVPESVQETLADQRAKQRRDLLRVATTLIDSDDIPAGREAAENVTLPTFEYPSTEEKH